MDASTSSCRDAAAAGSKSPSSTGSSGRSGSRDRPAGAEDAAGDGEPASLRGLVEEAVLKHREAFPPPALTYASSSSSTSFGSSVSSTSTSRTTSPSISSSRFPPTSPRALSSATSPIDVAAATHKLSKLNLPAPSLPLSLRGGGSGGSTPMAIAEPSRPDESGGSPMRSRTSKQSLGASSGSPSPLSTPPILPQHSGFASLAYSPAGSVPSSPSTVSTVSTVQRGSSASDYDAEGQLRPPNFGVIAPGAYRSSFPKPEHFPFLRTLGLKTILLLVIEPYPEVNRQFAAEDGIEVIQLGMPNNKDPLAQIPAETIRKALAVLLDVRKQPLLVHCNRGKHRTGCVVGCLRRLQRWPIDDCLAEYTRYSTPKERVSDQSFIRAFGCDEMWSELVLEHVPPWPDIVPPSKIPDNCAPDRPLSVISSVPRRVSDLGADDEDDPSERSSTPRCHDGADVPPFGTPRMR